MTADQIDKAAEMFKRGVRVGNIAKRLGTDAKEIRKALRSRGLMFLTPPPATLVLKSVPRWCVDRLTSAAAHRRMAGAEELATMILISRLTRGSVDADLRGFGDRHPEALGNEASVRELILE